MNTHMTKLLPFIGCNAQNSKELKKIVKFNEPIKYEPLCISSSIHMYKIMKIHLASRKQYIFTTFDINEECCG